jgi:oligoendopeptidase F
MKPNSILKSIFGILSFCSVLNVFAQPGNYPKNINQYVWNLSPVYKNEQAWQEERNSIVAGIRKMDNLKNATVKNAIELANIMDAVSELRAKAAKLVIYSVLVSETDNQSAEATSKYNTANSLEAQVEAAVSFLRKKIMDIGSSKINLWLAQEPRLKRHRQRINRILLESPHTVSSSEQSIVESFSALPRTYGDLHDRLTQSEIGWPQIISSTGDSVTANLNTVIDMRRTGEAGSKIKVEKAFLEHLNNWQNIFGLLYTNRINCDLILAKQKKFNDGIDAIWQLRDGVQPEAYKKMISFMRNNTETLKRYARVRIKVLGLKENTYSNFTSGMPANKTKISIDSAITISVASLGIIGSEYSSLLKNYLSKPDWMHLPPTENKNPTYGIFPAVGGIPSYFMQTYRGSYTNVRNFTGAMALVVTFNNIPTENKPDTRDDPGIYSNAIIYAGRILFDEYIFQRKASPQERTSQLLSSLEMLWRFYQTGIIMELDLMVQDKLKKNQIPSGEEISKMYYELLQKYYGGTNGLLIEPYFQNDWITEPVTFSTYEHQFWCPAIAAGCMLSEKIVAGDAKAKDCMYKFLGRGDVDLSYQLFMKAGIDLNSNEPYQAVIDKMNALINELNKLL